MIEHEDKKIGVSILAEGVALPLSSINDYYFYIYTECAGKKTTVAVYKKTNTGLFAIIPDLTKNNRGYIVYNRKQSNLAGKYYLEVMVQLTAGSEFINLKQNKGVTGKFLFEVEVSANNGELQ